jgi:NADH-quinone oxidoreductase subunit L
MTDVMLAAVTALPLSLYATLPLWPLLGAIVVGLWIAFRWPAERAYLPVVLAALAAAVLGLALFFDLGAHGERAGPAGPAHAATATGQADRTGHGDDSALVLESAPALADAPHGAPWVGADVTGTHTGAGVTLPLFDWISLGQRYVERGQWIAFNFLFDRLTGMMLLYVTVVSLVVVIYAVGYMRDHHGHPERGYERFFAFLGLFIFSMCVLVLAGNFVVLYLGWELVGLCSYLLIGFYYPKPEAAAAAKKAFLVNRIGDFGFALGIFALYMFIQPHVSAGENPLDYEVVFRYAHHLALGEFAGWSQATVVSLLLLCGAIGKSAQFPLYVWLPDAMEGPTPVSALIHAATMVTAGIYMVARCGPLFAASTTALTVVTIVGVVGAVLAATIALAQYDMKRILAYSTISQLAFMFVGLGCGAPDSAVFHVFTHAWFKALLFLGAGSVMHAMGGVIDVRRFSGLRAVLPQTRTLMLIGCLALAGVPPLAGFWSKDEIVHAAFASEMGHRLPWLGWVLIATAGLTAYYTFRMYFLCFHGPLRLPHEAGEPHESPPVMLRPLYVLALGALLAGLLGVHLRFSWGESFLGFLAPHGFFHHYLASSTIVPGPHHGGGLWIMYLSAAVAIAGIALAWVRHATAPEVDPDAAALGPLWRVWRCKYWVDELYDALLVQPLRGLAQVFDAIDRHGIDGVVWLVAAAPRAAGYALRGLQRGALQGYALGMLTGLALLLLLWRLA